MNPFDLRGPEFLVFYAVLTAVVVFVLHALRRKAESRPLPKLSHVDPYSAAYLRGGAPEALRVAMLALLDRKLLESDGDKLVTVADASGAVRRPIERAILDHFKTSRKVATMFWGTKAKVCAATLDADLRRQGLLPDGKVDRVRLGLAALVLLVLGGTAVTKILIALSRGRHNVELLVAFAFIGVVVALGTVFPRRTKLGDRVLADLRTLCKPLKRRAKELKFGAGEFDLALLAGVFGMTALRGEGSKTARKLFPQASRSSASSSSSCGSVASSCGSSSGGSSCGGGGGGCGGCGS